LIGGAAAVALVLAFGFAFSWVMGSVGLAVKNAEAAQAAGFLVAFPLTFASSVFVPASTMPSWLQVFVNHQPVTLIVDAVRGLMGGTNATSEVVQSLIWVVAILVVFVPVASSLYRKASQ
jgi:ABC-type multidrug transport system permease subunit